MSDTILFFHLFSKTMRPCYETKAGHAEAMRTILCRGCGYPKAGVKAVDVLLQGHSPRDKPLNLLFASGVGLIHRELLDLIGKDVVNRDLYLGQVTDNRGKVLVDWATFRARKKVVVRGSKEAEYRRCPDCGRILYHAAGTRYLFPAPPEGSTVFESDLSGLVVPAAIYERVSQKRWRRLGVDELPVLEEPIDGLGELP
jgi:hypothetical protein